MTITYSPGAFTGEEFEIERLLEPPSAVALDQPMRTRATIRFTSADERVVQGSWECEPGSSYWDFTDRGEIIHVLSGRMTVTEEGQDPQELVPGTTAIFPRGWKGNWTIHETLRKVFVIYR